MFQEKISKQIDRFVEQTVESLGDQLVSIVIYGGIAKKKRDLAIPDVNVMVVLKEVNVEVLDKLAPSVRKGVKGFKLSPLVLSEWELRTSMDVFPIRFLDMQRNHHTIWGQDVISSLYISNDHLRLRCEQEIKNLLIRLNNLYLQRSNKPKLIQETLAKAISSILNSLSAALVVKTGKTPVRKDEIITESARELELDGDVLQSVLALKLGSYKPKNDELRGLYNRFMATVQKAAEVVDEL